MKELEWKFEEEAWNPFCEETGSSKQEKDGSSLLRACGKRMIECKKDGTSSAKNKGNVQFMNTLQY